MPPGISRFRSLNISRHLHKFPVLPPLSLVSFSTSTRKVLISEYLVDQHHFSSECASNISSLSSTNYLRKPLNADTVLNFLKDNGFALNHLETLVQKVPWILSANLERSVKPKIKLFQDLGFHSSDLADIVSAFPVLLRSRADRLRHSVLTFKNVLGPNADISGFLKNFSTWRFLARRDLDRTLVPNVAYLKSCGICPIRIARFIYVYPSNFVTKPEEFKGTVQRVDEMGVNRQSKMFLFAVKVIGSMSRKNWELKLKLFRELGFSEQNISDAFRVSPQAFGASERKIKEVTQLLLSVEGFSNSDIVHNPVLLTLSVEKRFKPRLRVLKDLESKDLLKKRTGLTSFFQISHAKFMSKYVIPYLDELGDIYVAGHGS